MTKKIISLALLSAIMMMDSARLLAQNGPPTVAIATPSPIIHPLDAPPAGLVKLYSNLGSKTNAYDPVVGYLVLGPLNTLLYPEQWVAMPFTPTADATVRQVKVAVSHEAHHGGGLKGFVLAFSSDAGGVPGKTIQSWKMKNLFFLGQCCSMDLAQTSGIKVKKGTRYWIVAETDSTIADAQSGWQETWNHALGTPAFNVAGKGWFPAPNDPLGAFAVYGTKP